MGPQPDVGWPFWWRWVVATNLGWFPGIALGLQIATLLPASPPVWRACAAAVVASVLFGAAQSVVLRPFLARARTWWWVTALGWPLGVAVARILLDQLAHEVSPLTDAVVVAFIAGGVVGLAQSWVLSERSSRWGWWPAISAVGWGFLFPGAIPGIGLVWLARGR